MLVLPVMLLQSTAAMTLRPIAAHNRCTISMSGYPDWPPGVPPQRGGLRGAAARQAAREARIAAQDTAPPEVPSTDDSTSSDSTLSDEGAEVSAGSSSAKEDEELQVAQSPDEAKKRLQRMGATVIFPSSAGSARHPDASWSSLAGAGALREQVEEALVLPLRHPELFASVRAGTRSQGAERSAALLFYGPPGTGKTSAARIAAAQAGLPLVYAPLEALMSKWFGEAERALAALFEHCASLGRCVLFLDELDALGGSRSREIDEASRRMLSVLLRRLDGMDASPHVTLVAATNRREDLDAALLSRFDVRVHFAPPDAAARADIFGLYAKHLTTHERGALANAAAGLSGRDILDVCRRAENRHVSALIRAAHAREGAARETAACETAARETAARDADERTLPPIAEYEHALRARLETSAEHEDGATLETALGAHHGGKRAAAAAAAAQRQPGRAAVVPARYGPAFSSPGDMRGAGVGGAAVRPPGW